MKKKRYLALLVLSLALPVSPLIAAEPAEEAPLLMDEVVVTAGRVEQSTARIPAHVTVITAEQIQESGAQSVPDALRALAGVLVTDLNGNGMNQTVDMGGFGESAGRHVAVLVDGRRLNPIDLANVAWVTVPLEQIERIEVLHGGGAVLYGDNAMGGVINIITKEAEGTSYFAGELGFGSHGGKKEQVRANIQHGGGRMYLEYDHQESDGYRDRSASDRESVLGKVTFDIDPETYIWADLSVTSSAYELPGPLTAAEMAADRTQVSLYNQDDYGTNESVAFSLGLKKSVGDGGLWTVNLARQQEDLESDIWSYMVMDVETNSLNTQYGLDRTLAGFGNHLLLGFEYYDVDYGMKGDHWSGGTNRFEHEKQTASVYVKNDLMMTDEILVSAGVRYEMPRFDLQAETVGYPVNHKEMTEAEWAWDLGLSYRFADESKIYGRLYRSFRYPAVDEFTNVTSGEVNEDLKQETALGYEAGLRLAVGKKASIDLRLYQMRLEDEITWVGPYDTGQNENLDKTRHIGGELSGRYQASKVLGLYGGITYTKAELTSGPNDGNEIPQVPNWKTTAGVRYTPTEKLRLNGVYNYVGKSYFGYDYTNSSDKLDDYKTIDLSVSYQYSKQIELYLNGTNILNEKYSASAWVDGYYPMPEAVYWAGMRVKF